MADKLIVQRALNFVEEWAHQVKKGSLGEQQHAREFMADFYDVFGISKSVYRSGFEYKVKMEGHNKRIDSLLQHTLIIEMESQNVEIVDNPKAGYEQALKYAYTLNEIEDGSSPEYILACNFENFYLKKPSTGEIWNTTITDFVKDIDIFNFLSGYEQLEQERQAKVDKRAAESISKIYRSVLEAGVQPNAASLLMTRIVFCLFADDTHIFEYNGVFQKFLEETSEDGTDLLSKLSLLFRQLNTSPKDWIGKDRRFGYINGGLFALDIAKYTINLGLEFNAEIRKSLIEASMLDWSGISPVIFGSMFEGALDPQKRHQLGAHFTSEKNILKVVDSLFMDDLHKEFDDARHKSNAGGARTKALNDLHEKITHLKFMDPACGSGNFLIIAYRELRRLEHDIIDTFIEDNAKVARMNGGGVQLPFDFASKSIRVEVSQFYGIEILPYAVSIARVGMWLMDHLMNIEASNLFGELIRRIPLHAGANIIQADALKVSWTRVFTESPNLSNLKVDDINYIFGNPPFIGQTVMTSYQKEELKAVDANVKKMGKVDYVAGWYLKSADIMSKNPNVRTALVSTNSIAQGEQAVIVGQELFRRGFYYNFVHQTFKWDNNGAKVFAVIIGFSLNKSAATIFSYANISDDPVAKYADEINEYLLDMPRVLLHPTNKSIENLPKMAYGTMPRDGKNLIVSVEERKDLVNKYPQIAEYIRPFIGSRELLHNEMRYILYLKNAPMNILKLLPISKRLQAVHDTRLASPSPSTKKWANRPTELVQDQAVDSDVLLVPRVSSGGREYIPMTFGVYPTIGSDQVFQVGNATLSLFALLESKMHTAWMDTVGGGMKGDYRYSNTLVYNTFCIPNLSKKDLSCLEECAERIVSARLRHSSESLADLYGSLIMATDLRDAHMKNDRFVDTLYGLKQPTEKERTLKLIEMYHTRLER
ncbi:DNA methyltransferase [Levilactobacillus cerevisiae]|uniref:DNA methyltransferase n=1 Tax=Levilactobacillus cerevisiae TaxID=1704076 RepID=UPI000F768B25|nr:DNA methyltransferase [Levilactobacillus cerevisiae]